MSVVSGIYQGLVVHQRLRPKPHRLSYRVFSLLIDLDEIDTLGTRLKLLRFNRPGLMSFHEKDHGDGGDLKAWVRARLGEAGISANGPIQLLCYPRMFGYVFNPLSVYYCHERRRRAQRHRLRGPEHLSRAPGLCAAGGSWRRAGPAFLRQGFLRLALHAHGVPLQFRHAPNPATAFRC